MQLPVDIGALLEEAVNVEAARATPLSVSVYVDETAPGDVAAHVRQAFASASDTARVSLIYLDGREFAPSSGDDMACIVAGLNENVGAYARACRKAGVRLFLPPLRWCGDNGAMIGAQGYYEYQAGRTAGLDLNAYATMDLSAPLL